MRQLALVLTLATLAAPASAQWNDEKRGMVAIGGGIVSPSSDDLNTYADRGFDISGFVAREIKSGIGWRLEGSYSRFGTDDVAEQLVPGLEKAAVTHVGGGLQLGGFRAGGTSVYTAVTAGYFHLNAGVPGIDTDSGFGLGLGTGLGWSVEDTWGIGLEFKFNGFNSSNFGDGFEWFTQTGLMVFFRF